MSKIKLMHLMATLGMGGAEKVVLDLSRLTNRATFEVTVVSLTDRQELLPSFLDNNINVEILHTKRTINSVWHSLNQLIKLVERYKIDILHAHLTHANILATLLKLRFPKLKLVFTPHSTNLGSKLRETFVRVTKKIRDGDILFSESMKKNIYRQDVAIIPNGIDSAQFRLNCTKFAPFTFICIGRLESVKNQIALIDPILQLKKRGYQFQVLLIGEGVERTAIEKAIQEHELQDCVRLLGLRRDIPKLCNQAHCLLIPSLWEGLPIALLEGGASGLPIISVNVGSIPILLNKKTGYLIDNLDLMSTTMAAVMDNYEAAKTKSNRLRTKIQQEYDIQSIVEKHEQLYQSLIYKKQATSYSLAKA